MRLGGTSEVARELGISRQRVGQLRSRGDFPNPVGEISAGPVWDLDDVANWNTSGVRRGSGRPKRTPVMLADRYALDEEPIGSGGFADVYRATDVKRDQSDRLSVVAIKILRELNDPEIRRRFERELRLVQGCSHPHIVPILDSGEDAEGHLWYSMPLAKGSLVEEIDRFTGDETRILHVMRQVCDALSYVHAQGIFHRDLKPANILRTGVDTYALADFGLAREAERTTTALTSTLQGVGTFFFAAPEAWKGAKYAVATADVYSLGKILQQLVTGELPIDAEAPAGRFRNIIQRSTRQRPDQRYQSINEMAKALERAATAPTQWSPGDVAVDPLKERLRSEVPDPAAIIDLASLLLNDPDAANVERLQQVVPVMSRGAVEQLWHRDAEDFRVILDRYGRRVDEIGWQFSFCDTIANFFDRCVLVTNDADVLRTALRTLIHLGPRHNRWHVRDVVVGLLQRVRTADAALAAAEALREADVEDVRWTLEPFAARSLHPTIRVEAEQMLQQP